MSRDWVNLHFLKGSAGQCKGTLLWVRAKGRRRSVMAGSIGPNSLAFGICSGEMQAAVGWCPHSNVDSGILSAHFEKSTDITNEEDTCLLDH